MSAASVYATRSSGASTTPRCRGARDTSSGSASPRRLRRRVLVPGGGRVAAGCRSRSSRSLVGAVVLLDALARSRPGSTSISRCRSCWRPPRGRCGPARRCGSRSAKRSRSCRPRSRRGLAGVVHAAERGVPLVGRDRRRGRDATPGEGVRLASAALALSAELGGAAARSLDAVAATLRDRTAFGARSGRCRARRGPPQW